MEIQGTVFCYQNCSDLLWEKSSGQEKLLKFKTESPEIHKIFEITRTIIETEGFFTGSWRFPNIFEQLESKLEKIIVIQKPTGKVRKAF